MITKFLTKNLKPNSKSAKFILPKFFSQNQPVKSDSSSSEKKKKYPEDEPKRFGKSYDDYIAQKETLEDKKRAIEKSIFDSQNIDNTEHFRVQDRSKKPKMDRETELDIAQFKLTKPQEYYLNNLEKRPVGVFDFADAGLSQKSGVLRIDGFDDTGFEIGNIEFNTPLVLFSRQIFMWDVYDPADIRAHNFEIINLIKPLPGNFLIFKLLFRICYYWSWKRSLYHS